MYLGQTFDFFLSIDFFEYLRGPKIDPLGSERVFPWGLITIFKSDGIEVFVFV
jgi:hypothetical protein